MKRISLFLLSLFLARPVLGASNTIYSDNSSNAFSANAETHRKNKPSDTNPEKGAEFHFQLSSTTLSQRQEYKIIQNFLQSFYQSDAIEDDPIVQSYLESIIDRLIKNTELQSKNAIVLLIKNPMLNAFSFYGTTIGVYTGLIYHIKNEEELIAVLAHELVHINQKHFDRSNEDGKNIMLPTIAGLLGTMLLKNPDVGAAAISSIMGGVTSHLLSFSRKNEEEADRIGINLMYLSDINPYGMSAFLKRMKKLESQNQPPELFRTHPMTAHRISDAESFASQYPTKRYPKSSVDFDLIRIHILFNYLPALENPVTYLQGYIKNHEICSEVAHYGMAMAYYKNSQYKKAAEELAPLLKTAPDNKIYQLLYNQVIYNMNEKQQALTNMQQLVDSHPDYFPASVLYARLLNQSNAYQKSQSVLKKITAQQPQHPFVWKLLAETSSKISDRGMYFIATAHYLRLSGQTDQAINRLKYVLNNQRIAYSEKLLIQQLLATLRQEKG